MGISTNPSIGGQKICTVHSAAPRIVACPLFSSTGRWSTTASPAVPNSSSSSSPPRTSSSPRLLLSYSYSSYSSPFSLSLPSSSFVSCSSFHSPLFLPLPPLILSFLPSSSLRPQHITFDFVFIYSIYFFFDLILVLFHFPCPFQTELFGLEANSCELFPWVNYTGHFSVLYACMTRTQSFPAALLTNMDHHSLDLPCISHYSRPSGT